MNKVKNILYAAVASILLLSFLAPDIANAATILAPAEIRLGRLAEGASTNNDLLAVFKLNDAPTTVTKIVVTIPTGFTVAAVGSATAVSNTFPLTPATITALPGSPTYTSTSGGAGLGGTITVTAFTSASLTSANLYGFDIPTGVVTNPSSAAQYNLTLQSLNGATPVDTTTVPVSIYGTTGTADQIIVNASVAPNFSFTLGSPTGSTDTIPTVDPTTVKTSPGITMTVGTNSPLGYTAYVASKNNALLSPTQTLTPINDTGTFGSGTTPMSIIAGTTNYGFVPSTGAACSSCTGTITYNGAYNIVDGAHAGPFNGTSFAAFVSRNGYTNADTILLQERVAVSTTIGYASDYTDTLTIVAAGNF